MPARRSGPPAVLQWMCAATLPGRQREVVLGDLFELYLERARSVGRPAANRWYVVQMLRALGPTLSSLPAHVFSPRRYSMTDALTIGWFTAVALISIAFLVATGLY